MEEWMTSVIIQEWLLRSKITRITTISAIEFKHHHRSCSSTGIQIATPSPQRLVACGEEARSNKADLQYSTTEQSRDAYMADRHSNRDTSRLLVLWRGERWKPLEAGEEDEEGRSMAPTRLPRCVRQAKGALCALPPPCRPFLWSAPLGCITPLALFFYPSILFQGAPTALYSIANLYVHIWCDTFCYGK